jgi:hypothetical protein
VLAPVTEREGHYRRVRSLNRRTVEDSVFVGYSQSSATKLFAFPLSIFCISRYLNMRSRRNAVLGIPVCVAHLVFFVRCCI